MQSIDRKLARLARELEAAKPKVMSFDDFRFICHDINGATQAEKVRTVDDVFSDPTEDEMQYIVKLRGGCRCSWPNAAPPCNICTDEYTEEEAAEALAECSAPAIPAKPVAAPPKFKVGDRVRTNAYLAQLDIAKGLAGVVIELSGLTRVVVAFAEQGFYAPVEWNVPLDVIELIPSEPQSEGWVAHRPGDPCPVDHGVIVHCKTMNGKPSLLAPALSDRWAWTHVTAYRVIK